MACRSSALSRGMRLTFSTLFAGKQNISPSYNDLLVKAEACKSNSSNNGCYQSKSSQLRMAIMLNERAETGSNLTTTRETWTRERSFLRRVFVFLLQSWQGRALLQFRPRDFFDEFALLIAEQIADLQYTRRIGQRDYLNLAVSDHVGLQTKYECASTGARNKHVTGNRTHRMLVVLAEERPNEMLLGCQGNESAVSAYFLPLTTNKLEVRARSEETTYVRQRQACHAHDTVNHVIHYGHPLPRVRRQQKKCCSN
jgi:hypothetical protein